MTSNNIPILSTYSIYT